MIPKKPALDLIRGGYRFSERIMLQQKALEPDDDSKKSHPALPFRRSRRDPPGDRDQPAVRGPGDDRSRFRRNSSINWAATEHRWFGRGCWKSGVFATRAPPIVFPATARKPSQDHKPYNQSTASIV